MGKLGRLFFTFLKIGAFTFGGGYAMIALLETEFIDRKKWMTREEFLDMVAIAESTPGPVAINSATYIGYKVAGVAGAALATLAACRRLASSISFPCSSSASSPSNGSRAPSAAFRCAWSI